MSILYTTFAKYDFLKQIIQNGNATKNLIIQNSSFIINNLLGNSVLKSTLHHVYTRLEIINNLLLNANGR